MKKSCNLRSVNINGIQVEVAFHYQIRNSIYNVDKKIVISIINSLYICNTLVEITKCKFDYFIYI